MNHNASEITFTEINNKKKKEREYIYIYVCVSNNFDDDRVHSIAIHCALSLISG